MQNASGRPLLAGSKVRFEDVQSGLAIGGGVELQDGGAEVSIGRP